MSEAHDQDIRFGRGATLMEQGAHGDFCYLILSGRVEVFRMEDDAKLRLAEMGEGGVVGEMALIDPAPRVASVVAIEPTVCRRINATALDRALDAAPPLARYLLQTFIRNIRHAEGIAPPAQVSCGGGTTQRQAFGPAGWWTVPFGQTHSPFWTRPSTQTMDGGGGASGAASATPAQERSLPALASPTPHEPNSRRRSESSIWPVTATPAAACQPSIARRVWGP